MMNADNLDNWKVRPANWVTRIVGPKAQSWAPILTVTLPVALATNAPHEVGGGFAQWAARLRGPHWPKMISRFIRRLNNREFANALFDAVLPDAGQASPGARAVALSLAPAAHKGPAEILDLAEQLAEEAPSFLESPLIQLALSMLPHPNGARATPRARQIIAQADLSRTMVVAPPTLRLSDLAPFFPSSASLEVCTYRPSREALDRWLSEARAISETDIRLVDTFESGGDLNSESQSVLSALADRIAECALASPELSDLLAIENFGDRHREAAELALSDRVFSWFRTQAAFARQITAQQPTTVVVFGSNSEVRNSVLSTCKAMAIPPALFEAAHAHSVGALDRYWRAEPVLHSGSFLKIETAGLAIRAGTLKGRGKSPGTEPEGFAAWSGPRLYAPTAATIIAALAPSANIYQVPFTEYGRGARCNVSLSAGKVHSWLTTADPTAQLPRLLSLPSGDLVERVQAICTRFFSVELPKLVLIHAASAEEIRQRSPAFGLIMPTRHPGLRIIARNLMAAAVPVHEVQTVYLTSMPRYRPPVATCFHAIDTYSARQISETFRYPEECIRLGGIVREKVARRRRPKRKEGRFRIIIATQPTPLDENLSMIRAVRTAAARIDPNWEIIVRPHPAENSMRIGAYGDNSALRSDECSNGPDALADADILVSAFSNLVIEGAVAGLRAVVFWQGDGPPPVPFEEMGIAVRARGASELEGVLRDFSTNGPLGRRLDRQRRNYLSRNPQLAGGAAGSIAQEILATIA